MGSYSFPRCYCRTGRIRTRAYDPVRHCPIVFVSPGCTCRTPPHHHDTTTTTTNKKQLCFGMFRLEVFPGPLWYFKIPFVAKFVRAYPFGGPLNPWDCQVSKKSAVGPKFNPAYPFGPTVHGRRLRFWRTCGFRRPYVSLWHGVNIQRPRTG